MLQEALGYESPVYAHFSLIFNPDGSKMSKRDKDKVLRKFVKENDISAPPIDCISKVEWDEWLSSKDYQLDTDDATKLADVLGIELPEINVEDWLECKGSDSEESDNLRPKYNKKEEPKLEEQKKTTNEDEMTMD